MKHIMTIAATAMIAIFAVIFSSLYDPPNVFAQTPSVLSCNASASLSGSTTSSGAANSSGTTSGPVQSFTTDSNVWEITEWKGYIEYADLVHPDASWHVEIWTFSGGFLGTQVGVDSSSKQMSALSTVAQSLPCSTASHESTQTFSTPVELQPNTKYAFVVFPGDGAPSDTDRADMIKGSDDTFAGGEGSNYVGGSEFNEGGDFAFALIGTSAAPTPTPTPTPTPSPTPRPIGESLIISEYFDSASTTADVDSKDFTWMAQPFDSFSGDTVAVDEIDITIRRTGDPENLAVAIYESSGGDPNVDNQIAIGFHDFENDVPIGVWTSLNVQLSPKALLDPSTEYVIVLGQLGNSQDFVEWRYGVGATFDDGRTFTASSGRVSDALTLQNATWSVPDGHSFIVFEHTLFGVIPIEEQAPGDPAMDEPAPAADGGYEYVFGWRNQYIGTPLVYTFTNLAEDTTFLIRQINEDGDPVSTLTSYVVEPDGANEGSFTHITGGQGEGAFDVFDATNGQRLVKHHLLEIPDDNFYDNESHRCGTNCAIAHGNMPYDPFNKSSGRLHDTLDDRQVDESQITSGDFTFIHYTYNSTDTDDVFIAITRVDTLEQKVKVSLTDVMDWQGLSQGTTTFDDDTYRTNFLVLNTTGNNLGFVQNGLLADEWYGVQLPSGVYNYALVDVNDVVIAEGESVILVTPTDDELWQVTNIRDSYGLGSADTLRFNYGSEAIFNAYNDISILATLGVTFTNISLDYQSAQTVTMTQPDSVAVTLPFDAEHLVDIRPALLPFSDTPSQYAFTTYIRYSLTEACNLICAAENLIGEANLFFAALVGIVAIGFVARRSPTIAIVLIIVMIVGFGLINWLPSDFLWVVFATLGALAVIAVMLRSND